MVWPMVIDYAYKFYGNQKIVGTGLSFSLNFKYKIPPVTGTDSLVANGSFFGTLSADGKTIKSVHRQLWLAKYCNRQGEIRYQSGNTCLLYTSFKICAMQA